jgi:hypothetical protein
MNNNRLVAAGDYERRRYPKASFFAPPNGKLSVVDSLAVSPAPTAELTLNDRLD